MKFLNFSFEREFYVYAQAVKNSELSESQLRTVRKQFKDLGIQPITLKDKSEIEKLKFIL